MSVALYQPNDALVERLPTSGEQLGEYIKAIQAALVGTLFEFPVSENRALIVSIFPEQKMLCWVDAEGGTDMPNEAAELSRILASIKPPQVFHGPVAFAFHYSQYNENSANWIPSPAEWQSIAQRQGRNMKDDEILQIALSEREGLRWFIFTTQQGSVGD